MAELKTKQNTGSVIAFIQSVADENKRNDCMTLLKLMKKLTKKEPALWGDSIVGFGSFHYKSEKSKQEGDWYMTGFSPRKQNLTIYIIPGFAQYGDLMQQLGKHKTGGSCLYINKLADVDEKVLTELITRSFNAMKEKYKK
jgi:23S rRNA A2030 N6-methylase RlmJ